MNSLWTHPMDLLMGSLWTSYGPPMVLSMDPSMDSLWTPYGPLTRFDKKDLLGVTAVFNVAGPL